MQKFKVGIIGHTGRGNYGHRLDQAFVNNEHANIVALTDFNKTEGIKKAQELGANYYPHQTMMFNSEVLDIVVVAPRFTDCHYSLVKEALLNNCHVLCEKPFVQNLEQADELISLATERNLKIAVSLPFSYEDRFIQLKNLLKDNLIGEIYKMEGVCKHDHRGGGEDFAILGPHFADMMLRIVGNPIVGHGFISKDGVNISESDFIEGNEGLGKIAGDSIFATYQFDNGIIGTIQSKKLDILERSEQPYSLNIYGEKGILMVRAPYADHSIWYYPAPFINHRSDIKWGRIETSPTSTYGDYQKLVAKDLIYSIQHNREPKSNAKTFMKVLEMLLMPYYSHLGNKLIEFPINPRVHPYYMNGVNSYDFNRK
ncbi:Gfo/Idh/MocA family protein [Bacillus cereus group sp. BfR-BA-01380]|uniref:Gfo/Idh/MocA family protein n=1 Tax=Bacillus cereus group sp. BfR-BA-01380 TaxID=2920324 RepID=UPI001F58B1A8|nr:Gfo/Idh/MocA family oxidoreductase [Bacillus cereus group sp. BfR-BA-01380]